MRTLLLVSLPVLGYVLVREVHLVRSTWEPAPAHVEALRELALQAIPAGDVPVSALLLHGDSIIGRGYNTVLRDTNAGGHAEVNALSDALHRLGRERLAGLDREQLLMLTTFEPCAMCKGAMLEYGIDRTAFIEPKTLGHWMRQDLRSARIEWLKRRSAPEHLQDSLFRAHPAYDPATADH